MTWRLIVYPLLIVLVILLNFPPLTAKEFMLNIIANEIDLDEREACFRYISKYEYALKNKVPDDLKPNGRYQNCAWVLWLQGEEKAIPVVKNCIKTFRTYLKNFRLIILDENSISKYITLPKYIIDKYKSGAIPKICFADIVRYCLLYKYGGLWIDATAFLTDKFPAEILNQDFFMFSTHRYRSCYKLLTTNWLIYSKKPGNVILKDITNLNLEYWKHEDQLILYHLVSVFFSFAVEHDPEARAEFEKMACIYEQAHLYINYSSPYSDELLSELIKRSYFPIHKLSYKDLFLKEQGKIDEHSYEHSILHFFSRPNALEKLQKRGLAKKYD